MSNIAYTVVVQTIGTFRVLGKHIHLLLASLTEVSDTSPEAPSSKDILQCC